MRETDEMVDDDKPMEGEKMYKLRMDSVPKWHHGRQGVRLQVERRVSLRVLWIGPAWRRACGVEEGDPNHGIRWTRIGGDTGRWWCDI